jgi:muconolactone D-isomerase
MEFLVEFDITVPDGTPGSEVADRQAAEASAAAKLAEDGHLLRAWKPPVAGAEWRVLSLYWAESETELNSLLQALPLDGRPIPLGAIKQRALLAMLARQANATVSLHRLVDALWGEVAPAMGVAGRSASAPARAARAAARAADAPRSVVRAARAPTGRAWPPDRRRLQARPPSATAPRGGSVPRSPRVGG